MDPLPLDMGEINLLIQRNENTVFVIKETRDRISCLFYYRRIEKG